MQIECTIKREGGTRATIGTTTYHFKPDADGRHVAEVADPNHITAFLRVGCYIMDGAEASEPTPQPAAPAPEFGGADEDEDLDEDEEQGEDLDGEPDEGVPLEEWSEGDLIEEYSRVFKKSPHPNTKRETLVAKIAAAREAQ